MSTRILCAFFASAAVLAGCGEDRISGGGDEMGNFIRVSLRDSSGGPAAGARVLLRPAEQILSPSDTVPAPVRSLVADLDGQVRIPSPGTGRWTLVALLGNTGRAQTISTESGRSTPSETLTLGTLSTVVGRLEPNVAGAGSWISLTGRAQSTLPDSLGNFRLDSVAPGPVEILAMGKSRQLDRKSISLESGVIHDAGAFAPDWSAWTLRKTIWLNTGARGVATSTTVTDLPVALNLTASDLDLSKLRSDFSDLRATRADGRPLPLSVERWDATSGTLTIWVGMDTVHAGRDSQAVVLRGGNPTAVVASENPFQSSHGWSGVWHMGQDLSDATDLGNDADDASTTYKSGGTVGECRWFTRTTPGRMSVAKSPNLDPAPTGDLMAEAWVRLDAKSSSGLDPIVSHGNSGYRLQRDGTSNFLAFAVLDSTSATDTATVKVVGKTNIADGQFHHVVGMRRGDSLLVFVDGVRDGQKLYEGATRSSSSNLDIGTNGSNTYWEGMIDEVRIGRASRSDDWIRLSCEGQKKTSVFVSR